MAGSIIAAKSEAAMKERYAFSIAVMTLGVTCFTVWWFGFHRYDPSPQQRSDFLTSYNPRKAIAPFECKCGTKLAEGGESASAGHRFVPRKVEYQEFYTAQNQSDASVTAAVEEDVERQLALHGVQIFGKKTDSHGALRIDYTVGQILGSVTFDPIVAHPQIHPAAWWCPIPEGFEDKFLRIVIEERWFPKGIPSQQELAQTDE
jgi:hypothetical protein